MCLCQPEGYKIPPSLFHGEISSSRIQVLSHAREPSFVVDTWHQYLIRLSSPFRGRHFISGNIDSRVAHGIGDLLLTLVKIRVERPWIIRIVDGQKGAEIPAVVFPVSKYHIIGIVGGSEPFERPA